jgi:hypothetical protein
MANGDIVVPESRLRAAMTVAAAGRSAARGPKTQVPAVSEVSDPASVL